MENEMFTFVTCSHLGHCVEYRYFTRKDADRLFDKLVSDLSPVTGLFVAYYCASVGGLVNAHYAS
jgi:hypothetical protein